MFAQFEWKQPIWLTGCFLEFFFPLRELQIVILSAGKQNPESRFVIPNPFQKDGKWRLLPEPRPATDLLAPQTLRRVVRSGGKKWGNP